MVDEISTYVGVQLDIVPSAIQLYAQQRRSIINHFCCWAQDRRVAIGNYGFFRPETFPCVTLGFPFYKTAKFIAAPVVLGCANLATRALVHCPHRMAC
jgi:hypothetical protein